MDGVRAWHQGLNGSRRDPLSRLNIERDAATLRRARQVEAELTRLTRDEHLHGEKVIRVGLLTGAPSLHQKCVHRAVRARRTDTITAWSSVAGAVGVVTLTRHDVALHGHGVRTIIRPITARCTATARLDITIGTSLTSDPRARRTITLKGLRVTGGAGWAVCIVEALHTIALQADRAPTTGRALGVVITIARLGITTGVRLGITEASQWTWRIVAALTAHPRLGDAGPSGRCAGASTGVATVARGRANTTLAGVRVPAVRTVRAITQAEGSVRDLPTHVIRGAGLVACAGLAGHTGHHTLPASNIARLTSRAFAARADGAIVIDRDTLTELIQAGKTIWAGR